MGILCHVNIVTFLKKLECKLFENSYKKFVTTKIF